jgi:PAS domain S-box-containing protein
MISAPAPAVAAAAASQEQLTMHRDRNRAPTDVVQGEEALGTSEERLRLALAAARMGIWSWDFSTNGIQWSDQIDVLLGLAPGSLDRSFSGYVEHIHPEDRDAVRRVLREAREGPTRDLVLEYRVLWPDGSERWVEGRGRVYVDQTGRPANVTGTLVDITDRKRVEREREVANQALACLARRVTSDGGDLETVLQEITRTAADTLNVERCSIWVFDAERTRIQCLDIYERTPGRHAKGAELAAMSYPAYFAALRRARTLAVRDARADPCTSELRDDYLDVLGVSSLLDAPVHSGRRLMGVVCHEHVGQPRDWSPEAQSFAGSIADLACRAMEGAERRRAEQRLHVAYEQLQNLTRRLEAAKEEERRAIARELHDEMGQALTAIKINIHLASEGSTPDQLAHRLSDTLSVIDRLIDRIRAMSLDLRPPLLDELGLVPALRGYLEAQERRSGLRIVLTADPESLRLPPELEIAGFRVVQEAVTNVVRHAEAHGIRITLAVVEGHLDLSVIDDGRGFALAEVMERAARGQHLGLLGIQERALTLGGDMRVLSAPGQGAEIHVRVPVRTMA